MRVALVSPYSWTYPGGVTRHIEALAARAARRGHDVRVLAPFDRDDRRTALLHRGTRPQRASAPDWLVPLGGTIGWPSNGAVSNLAGTPVRHLDAAPRAARRRLRRRAPARAGHPGRRLGRADLAPTPRSSARSTATRSAAPPHMVAALLGARRKLNRLNVRIAVSEAAAWTGRRFYGGDYRVVPNGVALPDGGVPAPRARAAGRPAARSSSSARPSSARACRSCCAPSRRCAATCPPS